VQQANFSAKKSAEFGNSFGEDAEPWARDEFEKHAQHLQSQVRLEVQSGGQLQLDDVRLPGPATKSKGRASKKARVIPQRQRTGLATAPQTKDAPPPPSRTMPHVNPTPAALLKHITDYAESHRQILFMKGGAATKETGATQSTSSARWKVFLKTLRNCSEEDGIYLGNDWFLRGFAHEVAVTADGRASTMIIIYCSAYL
jgi:hypothetical protein